MQKFKKLLGASILSFGIIASFNPIPAYATPVSTTESESTAVGGWTEENGYFVNPQAYSKAIDSISTYSTPKHTGRAEYDNTDGKSKKRAHGWTTWVGVYHYTRARMEDGPGVLTDSLRQWGYDGTEATSPWWRFDGVTQGSARTYYGSEE